MQDKILGLNKEIWFIFFFLVGSLIFFDVFGINFNEGIGITGAQTIPVDKIAKTFTDLYQLMLRGFLGSAVDAIDLNGVLVVRLIIVVFIIGALQASGFTKKYEKSGMILAFLIAIAVAAFTPQSTLEFIRELITGVMALIGLALIALIFWGMHKWPVSGGYGHFLKAAVYLLILFLIMVIFSNLDESKAGPLNLIGYVAAGIAMAACFALLIVHIIQGIGSFKSSSSSGSQQNQSQTNANIGQTSTQQYNPNTATRLQTTQQNIQQRRQQNQNLDKQLKSMYAQLEKDYNNLIKNTPATVTQQDLNKIDGMIRTILSEISKFGSLVSQIPDQGIQSSIYAQLQIIAGKLTGIRNMMRSKNIYNANVLRTAVDNNDIKNAIKGIGNYI